MDAAASSGGTPDPEEASGGAVASSGGLPRLQASTADAGLWWPGQGSLADWGRFPEGLSEPGCPVGTGDHGRDSFAQWLGAVGEVPG